MTITIHNTTNLVDLETSTGHVPARVWEGQTASGIPVACFITRIAVRDGADISQFEHELTKTDPPTAPTFVWPTRMILALVLALGLMVSACAGEGPALPSPSSETSIAGGDWHGSIVFTKPEARIVQTTWKFAPLRDTAGRGFEATATWDRVSTRAMTAKVIGSQFAADGVYASPLGCDGIVGSNGTVDAHKIDATFNGSSSCDSVFEGHMVLTR